MRVTWQTKLTMNFFNFRIHECYEAHIVHNQETYVQKEKQYDKSSILFASISKIYAHFIWRIAFYGWHDISPYNRSVEKGCMRKLEKEKALNFRHDGFQYSSSVLNEV